MILRFILFFIALVFIPFVWLGFNISGVRIGLIELYAECIVHFKSGEAWGPLDE